MYSNLIYHDKSTINLEDSYIFRDRFPDNFCLLYPCTSELHLPVSYQYIRKCPLMRRYIKHHETTMDYVIRYQLTIFLELKNKI